MLNIIRIGPKVYFEKLVFLILEFWHSCSACIAVPVLNFYCITFHVRFYAFAVSAAYLDHLMLVTSELKMIDFLLPVLLLFAC